MKIKSLLALLLVFVMIFSLTACGKTVEMTSEVWVDDEGETTVIEGEEGHYKGENSDKDSANSDKDSDKTGSSSDKSNSNVKGLGGANVVISGWSGGYEQKPDSPTYSQWTKTVKEIEKKYNCKLKWKNIENAVTYQNTFIKNILAGIKFADIATVGSGWVYPQYLSSKYLHPLDKYIDLTDVAWDQDSLKESAIDGKHYILFKANSFNHVSGIAYNRSVFKKFGVPDPSTYVKANNWTTETFVELAKKTTGTKDGVKYYGYSMTAASVAGWGRIFGGNEVHTKNGKKVYEPDKKFVNGIQFAYDLLNTDKIATSFSEAASAWESGKSAMIGAATYEGPEYLEYIDEADLGWTYMPKAPGEKDYYCSYNSAECYAIPSAAKNPEILAKIMADFFYPSKTGNTVEANLEQYFYDETSYQTAVQAVKKAQSTSKLSPTYPYIIMTIGWKGYGVQDKQSPQAYIASVKAQAQAELDDVWKQK